MAEKTSTETRGWALLGLCTGFWLPMCFSLIAFERHLQVASAGTIEDLMWYAFPLSMAMAFLSVVALARARGLAIVGFGLGVCLFAGAAMTGMTDHAIASWWSWTCAHDDGDACYALGRFYEKGSNTAGGTQDAFEMYRRSCALGGDFAHLACHRVVSTLPMDHSRACAGLDLACERRGLETACAAHATYCHQPLAAVKDGQRKEANTQAKTAPKPFETTEMAGAEVVEVELVRAEPEAMDELQTIAKLIAERAHRSGNYHQALERYRVLCANNDRPRHFAGCAELVASGFPDYREVGCARIARKCEGASSWTCRAYARQCHGFQSNPYRP